MARKINARRAGYTLLELSVATGLGCVILAALLSCSVFSARNFSALQHYRDLGAKSRMALDEMSRDIRQADYLSSYTTNVSLAFHTTDPLTSSNGWLTYTYNTNALTLTRISYRGSNMVSSNLVASTIILSNISYFHYDLFQRNPSSTSGGDLTYLTSTTPSTVKAIDFTWVCQETNYSTVLSADDVQGARVVIRKD